MRSLLAGLIGIALSQRTPLPPYINTPLHESAPVLSADGRQLYFWRLDDPVGFGAQDIFCTTWNDTIGDFALPVHLGSGVNDPRGNIPFSITPDGQNLLVYKEFRNPRNPCELGISKRLSGDLWSAPIQLKIQNFQSESGSSLTAAMGWDGRTLLLSMKSYGSLGGEDLYVSFYNPEQRLWSEPMHLGPIVNSPGDEITPFLAPDGLTMYFSSNGRPDSKGMDIYMTRRLDESWKRWSPPQRLPEPINSAAEDYYFKFAALKPSIGYFVSTDSINTLGREIYRAPIPPAFQPRPTVLVQGRVLERDTRRPIPNAEVRYYDLIEQRLEGTAVSAEGTGEYRLLLPLGSLYAIIVLNPGYFSISEQIDLRTGSSKSAFEKDIIVAPLQVDETFRLNGLYFDVGDSTLRPESEVELERLSWLLSDKPTMRIEIVGHTDSVGGLQRNMELSWRRANAVAKYLIARGIPQERLQVIGKGPTQPIADNRSSEGRALNRRVEFRVLSP
ncbi:MAG: OmpA family protein [Bacteroidia bacterium]|nr:OmpA family protein [Bacteroidia bacterium]MCX7651572.1 OmpA family protein [Bacteroidia bacterium]MDW8417252.1 OmpA family protein [Bacteroidia bacterium]